MTAGARKLSQFLYHAKPHGLHVGYNNAEEPFAGYLQFAIDYFGAFNAFKVYEVEVDGMCV